MEAAHLLIKGRQSAMNFDAGPLADEVKLMLDQRFNLHIKKLVVDFRNRDHVVGTGSVQTWALWLPWSTPRPMFVLTREAEATTSLF